MLFTLLKSAILDELLVCAVEKVSNTFPSQRTNSFNESCGHNTNLNIQES